MDNQWLDSTVESGFLIIRVKNCSTTRKSVKNHIAKIKILCCKLKKNLKCEALKNSKINKNLDWFWVQTKSIISN